MAIFHFSWVANKDYEDYSYYQHVEFEEMADGIEIRCDSPASECVHFMKPENYSDFNQAIGQPVELPVLVAAKTAVKRNQRPLVHDAVHDHSEVKFTWFDPDFYEGFVGAQGEDEDDSDASAQDDVASAQSSPRVYVGGLSGFDALSDEQKRQFAAEAAKQTLGGKASE